MTEIKKGGLSDFMGEVQKPAKVAQVKPNRKKKKSTEPANTTVKLTKTARDKINVVKTSMKATNATEVVEAMFDAYIDTLDKRRQRIIRQLLEIESEEDGE